MINSMQNLIELAKEKGPKKVALSVAQDPAALQALERAFKESIAIPVLFGDKNKISSNREIYHYENVEDAAREAVLSVRNKKTDILMKGKIKSADFLRTVLNKEYGIRGEGILSHVGIFEVPGLNKLIIMSDGGMNISPDEDTLVNITLNAIKVAKSLKRESPKVAFFSNLAMKAISILKWKFGLKGKIYSSLMEAFSEEVDVFIVSHIEAGNIFGKGLLYFGDTSWAGIIIGARAPVILPSRADTEEEKFLSIVAAVAIG